MKVRLNVPYTEKDLAKAKGAKWNPSMKTWYVEDITLLPELARWVNTYNVICEHLYIFKMERVCWKCKKETDVICLGSDKSYTEESRYQSNLDVQLFSYVESMSDLLATYLKKYYSYYPSYSKTLDITYYVNHCEHCSSIQGDNFLHEVPDESFYKKLCYRNSVHTEYIKIDNQFSIPLQATLPYYDEISSSMQLLIAHMTSEAENRASLNITQKLMNDLLKVSIQLPSINIDGV